MYPRFAGTTIGVGCESVSLVVVVVVVEGELTIAEEGEEGNMTIEVESRSESGDGRLWGSCLVVVDKDGCSCC